MHTTGHQTKLEKDVRALGPVTPSMSDMPLAGDSPLLGAAAVSSPELNGNPTNVMKSARPLPRDKLESERLVSEAGTAKS